MSATKLSVKAKLLRLLFSTLASLPTSVSWALAALLARVLRWTGSRAARVTDENLQLCYPTMPAAERKRLALQSLTHTSYMLFELARVWTRPWSELAAQMTVVEGEQLLKDALNDKRGLVVLGPHIGNWELLVYYLETLGHITALYQPVKSAPMNELVLASRQRQGSTLLPTDLRGVMGLFKALKAGGFTGILPDQVPDQGGRFAPFFGIPAYTMTLVYNLIQRTGCRVLMGACVREQKAFKLVFFEPDAAIYSTDEAESMAALNRSVEQVVALAPAQYQWEYKRFRKQQSPDEPRRYQYKK